MKFKLHRHRKYYGRLGRLSGVERLPNFELDTPNVFMYTNGGSVPHLTHDVLERVTSNIIPMQFPLSNLYSVIEVVEKFGNSLHLFVGLPEYVSYCVLQDPIYKFPEGTHRFASATIKFSGGVRHLTSNRYMEVMEAFQPDVYVSMHDCDTGPSTSSKRLSNAVSLTNSAFQSCYNAHTSSPILKNKGLIAPVAGGYDFSLREKCAKYLSDFPVLGYLIDGLFTNGERVHELPFESVLQIVSFTVNLLPEERLRIIHGAWEPHIVLELVKLGIDIFDTSLPALMAENERALVFNYNVPNLLVDDIQLYRNPEKVENTDQLIVENGGANNIEHEVISDNGVKKPKLMSRTDKKKNCFDSDDRYSICLRDTKYFDDLTPLVDSCSCLTCRKHTKAYIHHLLVTKELLAPILLTMHNLHHYMEFFRKIREHLKMQI